ncbi:Ig-like domain-containing protein [Candidatus Kapabacteria bacterium]|nr:Ig-like domain-containing protein [Candidatus Kapabacteria bacterium]
MKRIFTGLTLLVLNITTFANNNLIVNIKNGDAVSYPINDINEILIVNNIISVESIAFNSEEISLDVGSTYQIEYTILPTNATNKNVIWTSSNEEVASIENGKVNSVSVGETIITAETEDGNHIDTLKIIVTSVSSLTDNNDLINIYPNPVHDILFIDSKDAKRFEIVISDMSGNLLLSQFDNTEINVNNLSNGIYFLTLIINNEYFNYKLIKN